MISTSRSRQRKFDTVECAGVLLQASVLGFSMGAVAALRLATRAPERVERLILASAMASPDVPWRQ